MPRLVRSDDPIPVGHISLSEDFDESDMQARAKYCGISQWVGGIGATWQAKSAFLQA
jgi:hypothetical protein